MTEPAAVRSGATILIFMEGLVDCFNLKPVHSIGEKKLIFTGVLDNPRTSFTTDIDLCDYIFLDFRDVEDRRPWPGPPAWKSYKPEHLARTIVIDWRDNPRAVFNIPCLKYFKRSVVCQSAKELVNYQAREIIPISYSIKKQYLDRVASANVHERERDTDISIFFTPSEVRDHPGRNQVAQFIKDSFSDMKIQVGICGSNGEAGRSGFQEPYYNQMLRSKIVVTCNPTRWEGDYRTWEALSSGALVMVDRMLTPIVNPLRDGKHVVFYDLSNLAELKKKLLFYLNAPSPREEIAKEGTEFAVKYHTASNRVDEILSHLETREN